MSSLSFGKETNPKSLAGVIIASSLEPRLDSLLYSSLGINTKSCWSAYDLTSSSVNVFNSDDNGASSSLSSISDSVSSIKSCEVEIGLERFEGDDSLPMNCELVVSPSKFSQSSSKSEVSIESSYTFFELLFEEGFKTWKDLLAGSFKFLKDFFKIGV